jgi:urease accessory protein
MISRSLIPAVLALLLPVVAAAHPGHAGDMNAFLAGAVHPLTGLDHLLFMLGLGVYVAHRFRKSFTAPGFASLAALVVGTIPPALGLPSTAIETGVLVSLVLLGLALLSSRTLSLRSTLLCTFVLALSHGLAHGETPYLGTDRLAFIAGLVATSGFLFVAGAVLPGSITAVKSMAMSRARRRRASVQKCRRTPSFQDMP